MKNVTDSPNFYIPLTDITNTEFRQTKNTDNKRNHEEGILPGSVTEKSCKKVKRSYSEDNLLSNKIELYIKNSLISGESFSCDALDLKDSEQEQDSILMAVIDAIAEGNWQTVQNILRENPQVDLNHSIVDGEFAGVTIPWLLAIYQQWDLFQEILQYDTSINFDATPLIGDHAGLTVLWYVVFHQQWEFFDEALEQNPKVNLEAITSAGELAGITIPWLLSYYDMWDAFKKVLKINPGIDLDISPMCGSNEGASTLWMLAFHHQWEIFGEVLKLKQQLNFDATAKGMYKGISVLWLLAKEQQWDLLDEILKPDLKVNFDASLVFGQDAGITILWVCVYFKQWHLVQKILEIKPQTSILASPLPDSLGKKLIDIVTSDQDPSKSRLVLAFYLTLSLLNTSNDLLAEDVKKMKTSVERTFWRIFISFDNNNKENKNIFLVLPAELINKIALYVLCGEHSKFKYLNPNFLIKTLDDYHDSTFKALEEKTRKNIALLSFENFRWSNGLWDRPYTESQINDLHRMIETSLKKFQEKYIGIEYSTEKRKKIVKEIGRKQFTPSPLLDKSLVKSSIAAIVLQSK